MNWARWQLYAVLGLAFVAGLFGIRAKLLADGEARLKAKIEERRGAAVREAQEIENEVEALGVDDLKHRARRWVRGSPR